MAQKEQDGELLVPLPLVLSRCSCDWRQLSVDKVVQKRVRS